jgi:drug/metabolite transporter (DMT)-like permease
MHRSESPGAHPFPEFPHPSVLIATILTGIAAISCASIFIRLADAPPVAIATYRVTLATMVIVPYYALTHRSKPFAWNRKLAVISMISGAFLAFHFIFWISSLSLTSVASSATLVSTTPIFVALFSYFILKERPSRRLKLGVLCTVLGSTFRAGQD